MTTFVVIPQNTVTKYDNLGCHILNSEGKGLQSMLLYSKFSPKLKQHFQVNTNMNIYQNSDFNNYYLNKILFIKK